MPFAADFHVHSCLSPCASLEMSPSAIASRAKSVGLDVVALTDHNSALNAPAFSDACARCGITGLYGLEICSIEEVHCLVIFDDVDKALSMSAYVFSNLPQIRNSPELFGDQVFVDVDENVLGEVELYLGGAANLAFEEISEEAHSRGALFIPAHIDKPMFSVISQLGFLPDGNYDAVEFSYHYAQRKGSWDIARGYPVVTGSDSHYLDDVGKARNIIDAPDCMVSTLRGAFAKKCAMGF